MTRKKAIIIFIVVLILSFIVISYLIFFSNKNSNRDSGDIATHGKNEIVFPINNVEKTSKPNNTTSVIIEKSIPKLRQLSANPVSGYTSFIRTSTTTVLASFTNEDGSQATSTKEVSKTDMVFRFIDRATGNIFETTNNDLNTTRITNTTIPKIYEATFFNSGKGVVVRYLDPNENIDTYIAQISAPKDATSTTSTLKSISGIFLPKNIKNIVKNNSSNKFFYTYKNKGYVFDALEPQTQLQISDSSITEWQLDWFGPKILLTTKPTYFYSGTAFSLSPKGGELEYIIPNIVGLSSKMNLDGKFILYSGNDDGILTNIYDVKNNKHILIGLKTLVDKCVWSGASSQIFYCAVPEDLKSTMQPDMWYKGVTSFNDRIIRFNVETNTFRELDGLDGQFDMNNLEISSGDDYILFQNKKDLSLWVLDIR